MDFYSKKLSPTKSNHGAYDRELLAVYLVGKHFRYIVEALSFTPRQIRHLDFISQFTTAICHTAGSENVVADAVSRIEVLETSIDFPALATAAQQQDEELERFRTGNTGLQLKLVRIPGCDVSVLCDVSTRTARPFVTESFRRAAFESIHRLSHPGVKATVKLVT